MKSLSWPAIVQKREGDIIEVKMTFDEKVRIVSIGDVEKFAVEKIANIKNSRLNTAFAKAVDLLKKY